MSVEQPRPVRLTSLERRALLDVLRHALSPGSEWIEWITNNAARPNELEASARRALEKVRTSLDE